MSDDKTLDEELKKLLDEIIEEAVGLAIDETLIEENKLEGNLEFVEELIENKPELINKHISIPEILNKSLSEVNLEEFNLNPFGRIIGTRSQKNIAHTELIPKKRVKNKKMVDNNTTKNMAMLGLTDALNMIPKYGGETEIYQFINICEKILESVEKNKIPLIVKIIAATKLINRAFNAIRYREITTWLELKKTLLDTFEVPYAAANLQTEFNMIRMNNNESVVSYNA